MIFGKEDEQDARQLLKAKEQGMYLIALMALWSGFTFATVTVGKVDCPQKFEGRVQVIIDSVGPSSAFQTHRVVFKNLHTLKGDVSEQVQVDLLKYGGIDVEAGQDYQVQVRDGRVCWIQKI